jgi:ABC-type uncharacterized transport system permease subunit
MAVKMKFWNELSFTCFQIGKNFKNERVLGASFLLQVMGMFISNLSFFIIWILFSKTIGTVNGWGTLQTFGMLSISIFAFGMVHSLFGSLMRWHEYVSTGAFDVFLTKPKTVYLRVMTAKFSVYNFGDIIQGILGIGIFIYLAEPSFQQIVTLMLMLIPAILIHISFSTICNCTIFWLPSAHNLSHSLSQLITLPSTQPISLLKGGMRFIYLFIIPALVVAGLPIEVFINPDWKLFVLSYSVSIAWFLLSVWLLNISIRRYESGNTIG